MDLDDIESDDIKLEWRYSTKSREKQHNVELKRPKLKKSYTTIDNFHHTSINDLLTPQKLFNESQKFINSQLKKNFLQSIYLHLLSCNAF